jgi:phage terminase small subunit
MAQLPATLTDSPDPETLTERERSSLWHGLTELQQEWLVAYLQNGRNATQAAKDAGYQCSSESAFREIGYKNRHHEKIQQLVSAVTARHMSADEALSRLAGIARSDMQDFLAIDENGDPVVDLVQAKERGALHLIKEIDLERTVDPDTGEVTTEVDLKLYDKRKALESVLDVLGETGEEEGGDTFQQFNIKLDQHHTGEESITEIDPE